MPLVAYGLYCVLISITPRDFVIEGGLKKCKPFKNEIHLMYLFLKGSSQKTPYIKLSGLVIVKGSF